MVKYLILKEDKTFLTIKEDNSISVDQLEGKQTTTVEDNQGRKQLWFIYAIYKNEVYLTNINYDTNNYEPV